MEYFRIFPRPSPNELGEREEGWWLASREQPQPRRDHVQELASSGRGNGDGSLRSRNSDRNWPSQGRGTGMYLFGFGVVQGVLGNKRVKDRDEFIR